MNRTNRKRSLLALFAWMAVTGVKAHAAAVTIDTTSFMTDLTDYVGQVQGKVLEAAGIGLGIFATFLIISIILKALKKVA